MGYDYDALYRDTPNALGAPTPFIVEAFERFAGRALTVLDLGCGQGRDALFIARAGHAVTGVDLSPNGVSEMTQVAETEGLEVTGVVADLMDYVPTGRFDIVLIDRTLHMLGATERPAVLARMLDHVAENGWVLIADEPKNIPSFQAVAAAHPVEWHEGVATRGYLFLRWH